jgi:hypothetical protein
MSLENVAGRDEGINKSSYATGSLRPRIYLMHIRYILLHHFRFKPEVLIFISKGEQETDE